MLPTLLHRSQHQLGDVMSSNKSFGSARGRRSSSTVCCQQQKQLCSSSRQTWAVLLLWLSLCSMNKFAAAVCNAVTYNCPTALDAAKAMTNNNLQLPITNAAFSLACPTTGYTLITDMGCHQLASTMPSGALVLSTGDASYAALLTNSVDDDGFGRATGVISTDPDMNAASTAAGYTQNLLDQVLLTFDLTPTISGNLAFQYVFGSEEYPEFVPTPGAPGAVNDIFGFFIWSGANTPMNVALLPNSTTPVSIATVNADTNTEYFVENTRGSGANKATEFDGYTTLLKTQDFYVTAGTTYHIKLGIADGGDTGYDSVVWVKSGSVRFNIKDCVGSFVPNGQCTGLCEGGSGVLPEVYVVTVAAQNGGNPCPITNGTTRSNTTCVNTDPCPVNCTASWMPDSSSCTGACGGGSGFTTELWVISSPALYGGYCAHSNGTARATATACTNNNPCPPVNCVGSWIANGVCSGACGGGAGLLPEIYNVSVSAAYGGTACPASHGDTRNTTACTNSNPCPINCVGSWVEQNNTCNGACAGGNGTLQEMYVVTTAAQYGGLPCPTADGNTRRILPCTNNNPCPVNCTYSWDPVGNCTGACSNGTGVQPEQLTITSAALYGGWCPGTNGSIRSTLPCINYTPCPPVDCVGAWGATYSCNGTCGGGNGTGLQQFTVTTAAAYGGVDCNYTNSAVKEVDCVNSNCCPVDCVGVWNISGNCSGHCQGGNGFIPETYSRIVLRSCGGVQCPYAHGQVRNTIACINNDTCPPQNCVGSWVWDGACNGTCGGGAGIRPEKYVITVPAMYNGTQCPEADATIRATTACTNTNPCPIDCVGNWSVITGNCTGACQGGQGFVPEMFNITVPAQYGGVNCNYTHGTYRYVINCTNNNPCPPRDCQGTWTRIGNCTGGCGGVRLGGRAPERFSITLPAAYGGNNCTDAEGDIRTGNCTNTTPCVNIPCNATWVMNGVCNGTCGGGSGKLPQQYLIYSPAHDNGAACVAANNTLRQTVACTNNNPCPINCTGSWSAYGICNGTCNNGTGILPERFLVTIPAQYGGANCSWANGTVRMSTACVNSTPCPVDCNGTWVTIGNCTGTCGGGAGLLPQQFVIHTSAQHGGQNCTHADGDTRLTEACNNTKPCPIHCVGHWEANGNCAGPCNNGTGTLPEKYIVTTAAMYEGAIDCPYANGTLQNITSCINPTPCPINCGGMYVQNGNCSGACNGGAGTIPEVYVITVAAKYGGAGCFIANGTKRNTTACINPVPCDPVNCAGGYVAFGPCSALCGGNTGFLPEKYTITTPSAYGGAACTVTNGTTRYSTPCTNNTVCPYADVQIVESPSVLPPLNMSSFNDSDIVIKGGNVSITGIKVEGVGASGDTSGSSSFTTEKIEAVANNATKPVKPRLAAFNGSLGFITFGMIIDVVGEFELQRTMNWTWDETWNAWITQVVIKGKFLLTREEIVNNVTVGLQTMEPKVAGYLTLYSAIYPGPGFSGTYDWAGKLEMSPDPFQEWSDAASLLVHNTTNNSTTGRKRSRALLQTSTGQAPVQGRVSVREAKEATTGVGSSSALLDETGDVMVVGPGPGPGSNPNYTPTLPVGNSSTVPADDAATNSATNPKLVTIVLAAVLAPAGVAMCATGLVGAILYRKRHRDDQQQTNKEKKGKLARLHKHHDGAVTGRQKQLPRSKGTHHSSNTLAEAELELSNPGSRKNSGQDTADEGLAAANLRAMRTAVERVRPGETGFGSMPGSHEAMITLPPRRDSVDWTSIMQVEASRQSYSIMMNPVNAMRNSLTGIANGFAQALRFRSSQAGAAYGVSQAAAAGFDGSVEKSSGSALLWGSTMPAGDDRAGNGQRMPTLPGSSGATYITKQGSLDMAAVIGPSPVSPRGTSRMFPERTYNKMPSGGNGRKPVTRSATKHRQE